MHILKRLVRYASTYWRMLSVAAILLLAEIGLSLLPPLFQRTIIDEVLPSRDVDRLPGLVGLLVAVYALLQLVTAGEQYLRHVLGVRFIFDLRMRIYAHLQRLSLSFYEQTSTGELMSRVTNDVEALENFVTHGITMTVVDLLRLLGASAILLVLDWRLSLARAILADPRILILDEATSSVDAEAEYLIQQALDEVMKGRTSLVIAHRLSTIRNADKIIALEEGHIREIGDHHELLARGGLYSQLYQRQVALAASEAEA